MYNKSFLMPVNSTIRCNDTNILQIGRIYIYEIINESGEVRGIHFMFTPEKYDT